MEVLCETSCKANVVTPAAAECRLLLIPDWPACMTLLTVIEILPIDDVFPPSPLGPGPGWPALVVRAGDAPFVIGVDRERVAARVGDRDDRALVVAAQVARVGLGDAAPAVQTSGSSAPPSARCT